MRFRNYCVIILGNTVGVEEEIKKIAETTPNMLNAKGIVIATFSSLLEPVEIKDWFKEYNRSFLTFDLDEEGSQYNIVKEHIHEGLFGFLRESNLVEMTKNFSKTLEENKGETIVGKKNKLSEEVIKNMSKNDKQNLLNELIDGGIDKLSEEDKKLLHLLVI